MKRLIVLLLVPMLAAGGNMKTPQQHNDSSSQSASDARSTSTSNNRTNSASIANSGSQAHSGDSTANNALKMAQKFFSVGYSRGVASDVLQECHERNGIKDYPIVGGGHGAAISINQPCLDSKREVESKWADAALEQARAARMEAEALLIRARQGFEVEQQK